MITAETPESSETRVPQPPLPDFTVVVPTYNEAGNVAELVRQLTEAVPVDVEFDIVFVDDSTDDTPGVITSLIGAGRAAISLVHRDEPVGGLGGAVVAGLRASRTDWVVVIDGDLQHPPTLVPTLLDTARRAGADIAVASRYVDGGGGDGLANLYRRLVSRGSTSLARTLFPRRLRRVSDPMSGFFAVRRSGVDLDQLRPIGYKIMLEVVVRGRLGRVAEVPYRFRERYAGESKSTLREGVRFLCHLVVLRVTTGPRLRRPAASREERVASAG